MKRAATLFALITTAALILAALPAYAQGGDEEAIAAARGAARYAAFCQACHGPQGEAVADGPAFAAISYDPEAARAALENGAQGEDGAVMPAYASVLGEEGIDEVLAYMATWGTGTTPALPEPSLHLEGEAEVLAGAEVYAKTCYGCHAAEGKGRGVEGFPAFEWSADSIKVVEDGGDLGAAHAFGAAHGGPLSSEQLAALEAYIHSWGAEAHAEKSADTGSKIAGLDVLLVVVGVATILIVGGVYGTNIIRTET